MPLSWQIEFPSQFIYRLERTICDRKTHADSIQWKFEYTTAFMWLVNTFFYERKIATGIYRMSIQNIQFNWRDFSLPFFFDGRNKCDCFMSAIMLVHSINLFGLTSWERNQRADMLISFRTVPCRTRVVIPGFSLRKLFTCCMLLNLSIGNRLISAFIAINIHDILTRICNQHLWRISIQLMLTQRKAIILHR